MDAEEALSISFNVTFLSTKKNNILFSVIYNTGSHVQMKFVIIPIDLMGSV